MAFGSSTFSGLGGAVSDLFAAEGHRLKARGDKFEQENYDLAAQLADKNVQFAATSTAIKQHQADRELFKSLGTTQADVAGAGFAESGSALDILRSSASEGALSKAVLSEQGLITEEGYKQQAQSYRNMSRAAQVAIDAEENAAIGSEITGALKGIAGLATLAI